VAKAKLHTEKYAVPATIDGIVALIREVLSGGRVKRIELDTDDSSVRAYRWVEEVGLEEEEVSWDGALRNVPVMKEHYNDNSTPYQLVVDMFLSAQDAGLRGVCWVMGMGGPNLVRKWFDTERRKLALGELNDLLGLPIHTIKSLPDETLILCCSKYPSADPTEISLAIKTTVDVRSGHAKEVSRPLGEGGDHTKEHAPATVQVALTTGGLRTVAWGKPY
jgi:hypothetical protein